jgi:hypothetical protein
MSMPQNKKPVRVQIPAVYLHPDTLKLLDAIQKEMAVNRGIAIDEVARRYRVLKSKLESLVPA